MQNLKEVWAYKIFIFELGFPWGHQKGKFEGSLSVPKIHFQAWTSLGSSGRKVWRNCECTKYSFPNLGLLGVANTSISRNFLPKAYLTFHRHLPYGCLRVKIKDFFELFNTSSAITATNYCNYCKLKIKNAWKESKSFVLVKICILKSIHWSLQWILNYCNYCNYCTAVVRSVS